MPVEWVTTSTLLGRLGDFENRGAWDHFAARFRLPLIAFARSLGMNDADAEDVTQESLVAFAEAYRKGQYEPSKGRLSKWLFGIAYRQALNFRRANARREARVAVAGASSFWNDVPDEQTATGMWDEAWETSLLEQCLEQVQHEVEPQTFRAFELTVREQRSPAQAAKELGVPVKLVYNAKHRLLKRIRELREEFDDVR
jgi:RNA polymerase sigma-70 factor (ECF subfamily)